MISQEKDDCVVQAIILLQAFNDASDLNVRVIHGIEIRGPVLTNHRVIRVIGWYFYGFWINGGGQFRTDRLIGFLNIAVFTAA